MTFQLWITKWYYPHTHYSFCHQWQKICTILFFASCDQDTYLNTFVWGRMQGRNSEKELWCVVHKKIVADVVFTLPMALSLVPLRQVGAGLTKVSLHKIFMALEKSDIYVVFCMCTCLTFPFCFFFASLSWPWLVSISLLLLYNKVIHTGQLKWMHIYYLTVFVSQESGNSSVRPSD